MKVVGRTREGFILTATQNELANLLGYYYGGADGCPALDSLDEIKVSEMYDQLYRLASKKDALSKVAGDLEELANLLRMHEPVVQGFADGEVEL